MGQAKAWSGLFFLSFFWGIPSFVVPFLVPLVCFFYSFLLSCALVSLHPYFVATFTTSLLHYFFASLLLS
jgi:hypothetical protein